MATSTAGADLEVERLPISALPGMSRLFLDSLPPGANVNPKLREFYAAYDPGAKLARDYPPPRRARVAEILRRQNTGWGASPQTLKNLERLHHGADAILTGQQVVLFGGPVLTVYKALTAIRMAEERTALGHETVPIFWLATTDHDLAEVDHVHLLGKDGQLVPVGSEANGAHGASVSALTMQGVEGALSVLENLYPDAEILTSLREGYRSGAGFGDAFARLFASLFAEYGLILLDPSDRDLQQLAAPVYQTAIERSMELNAALLAQTTKLESLGYHGQVKVAEKATLLFKAEDGARLPIQFDQGGSTFQVGGRNLSLSELRKEIADHPEQFTANALLRPVVQDTLLPTVAYTGGPAEIAYFAQAAVVFEKLLGAKTPVVPRFSATLIDGRIRSWLNQYGLSMVDCFRPESELAARVAGTALPADLQARLTLAEASISEEISKLAQALKKLDPSLADAAETALQKMQYQLQKLGQRAGAAELRKNSEVARHAAAIAHALYPEGAPQERTIAAASFLARYGSGLLGKIYQALRLTSTEHHILYL